MEEEVSANGESASHFLLGLTISLLGREENCLLIGVKCWLSVLDQSFNDKIDYVHCDLQWPQEFWQTKTDKKSYGTWPRLIQGKRKDYFHFHLWVKRGILWPKLKLILWLYLIDPDVWCSISFIGNEQEKRSIGTDMAWKKISPLKPSQIRVVSKDHADLFLTTWPQLLYWGTRAPGITLQPHIHQALCFSHSHLAK